MVKFRFEDLEIWKLAIEIAEKLFEIANDLDNRKHFRFAEQLRASGLSMSNNIDEGSGSIFNREFKQFLNIARRSTFENANMIISLNRKKIITDDLKYDLLEQLDILCRKITNFQKSLK